MAKPKAAPEPQKPPENFRTEQPPPRPRPQPAQARQAPPQPAPKAEPPPQAEPEPPPRAQRRQEAKPERVVPMSQEDVLANVLSREIEDPSQPIEGELDDPNIAILDEIARGISHGTNLAHIKDDVVRVASNQPEKADVVLSILKAIDLNRINDFVQIRAVAEKALKRGALRGDLRAYEYLAFMKYSTGELANIIASLKEGDGTVGIDSVAIIEKVDYAQQQRDQELDKQYKNTTPQGREMIRKQIFVFKQKLREAGKLRTNPDGRTTVEQPG